MATVYDFVFADRLSSSKYYAGNSFIKRFETDAPIRDYTNVIAAIVDYTNAAVKSTKFNLSDECVSALEILNTIKNVAIATGVKQEDVTRFKELLEVFSLYGFEIYLIERFDLINGNEPVSTNIKAYMVNLVDDVFPDLTRFAGGWCSTYQLQEQATLGRVLVDYLSDTIRLDEQVEDLLHMRSEIDDFNMLASAQSELQFDPTKLLNIMEANNYRPLIILQ